MKTRFFLILLMSLMVCSSSLFAQATEEEKEKDPFKNDPFFTKKIEDLLKKPSEQSPSIQNNNDIHTFSYLKEEGIDMGGVLEAGPYNSNPLYSVYPNLPMIHYNRVDALFLGIRKERMQWYNSDWFLGIPDIQTHGLLGYSFGLEEWQYSLGLEKYFGHNDYVLIGGEFHSASTSDDYWRVGLTETSLTSSMAGYDYLDYYKQEGWGGYVLFRSKRLFEGGVAYSNDTFHSLEKQTDWALFGSGNRFRPNPPVDVVNGTPVEQANIASLTFSASFNPKRLVISRYLTFSMNGTLELGDSGIAPSDYSYNKYLGEMVTFINFERGGIIKHRLKVGAITGKAPLFKEFELGGIGSLRALPYKSLPLGNTQNAGNQMILSNTEIQFGHPEWDSGEWIDFDEFYLSLFLDSGWTSFDEELTDTNSPFEGFSSFSLSELSHNAGIGVGSSSIRFELAWDLNNTSRAPVFWIRFNPTF